MALRKDFLLLWAALFLLRQRPVVSSFRSAAVNQKISSAHPHCLGTSSLFAATKTSRSDVSTPSSTASSSADASTDDSNDLPFFASWPTWLQNGIRDSGGVKLLVDTATRTLAAPAFYYDNPWCFPEFVRISGEEYPWLVSLMRSAGVIDTEKPNIKFSKEAYGSHPQQMAQVMIPEGVDDDDNETPLFLFLHGGAWGSGFPTMYRLLSLPFLQRKFRAVILGYRTYPEADSQGQMDDLCLAVNHFVETYGGVGGSKRGPVVLMGHSSGAHISMLAALQGRLPAVDAMIAASGIYNLESQYEQEKRMGVHEIFAHVGRQWLG